MCRVPILNENGNHEHTVERSDTLALVHGIHHPSAAPVHVIDSGPRAAHAISASWIHGFVDSSFCLNQMRCPATLLPFAPVALISVTPMKTRTSNSRASKPVPWPEIDLHSISSVNCTTHQNLRGTRMANHPAGGCTHSEGYDSKRFEGTEESKIIHARSPTSPTMLTSLRPLTIAAGSSMTGALARSFRADLSWRVGTPDTGRPSSRPVACVFRMHVDHLWKDVLLKRRDDGWHVWPGSPG